MVSIRFCSKLIFLLLCVCRLEAAELSTGEIEKFLQSLPQSSNRTLDFREEKMMRLLNKPIVTEGTLFFQSPNRFRREIHKPSPTITLSNGKTLWLIYPTLDQAEKYDLTHSSPLSRTLETLLASFQVDQIDKRFRIEASTNSAGTVLKLTPKSSTLRKTLRELILEFSQDLILTRTHLLSQDGSSSTTTYRNERIDPLENSLFEFTPSADMQVVEPLRH